MQDSALCNLLLYLASARVNITAIYCFLNQPDKELKTFFFKEY